VVVVHEQGRVCAGIVGVYSGRAGKDAIAPLEPRRRPDAMSPSSRDREVQITRFGQGGRADLPVRRKYSVREPL